MLHAQTDGSQKWASSTLSTATAGSIVSSPTMGPDGTVYIGVEVGLSGSTSQKGQLVAVNPNGSVKWQFTAPQDWVDSTPAIGADGTIYFGSWEDKVYAVNPNGTQKWVFDASPYGGKGGYIVSSPAIAADGTIYIGSGDSDLYAINSNGTLKWQFPVGDWVDSPPVIAPDGTIYFGSWDNNIYAVTPDGKEKWRVVTGGDVVSSAAIAADGTVYIGSRDLNLYAIDPNGTVKWTAMLGDTIESAPAIGADGTVYVTTTGGRLFALAPDGSERWRYPAATATAVAPIFSSPAVRADGAIIFGTGSVVAPTSNAVYAVRADGTLLWRFSLPDAADSSPLIASDNTIYIGCYDKKVYALNSSAGPTLTDWGQLHRDPQRTGRQPLGWIGGTTGRLINLSVRTQAGAGDNTLIVGFFVSGNGSRSLLVRGVGPTLQQFGVSGYLSDPQIAAYNSGGGLVASNNNWGDAPNPGGIAATASSVGAFPLPSGSLDAALFNGFPGGGYTVQVSGAGGATGIALMEAYDAGGSGTARLANLSARSAVGTGGGILIAGFAVSDSTRAILVRGVGPGLAQYGVGGTLADPQLRVYTSGGQLLAENDNWFSASNASALASAASGVGAFALQSNGKDAVMLLTLPPGGYTAQISGVGNTTGVALVEVYEVP